MISDQSATFPFTSHARLCLPPLCAPAPPLSLPCPCIPHVCSLCPLLLFLSGLVCDVGTLPQKSVGHAGAIALAEF